MIDGKTYKQILDLFDVYRTRHPERVSLHRFCLFAGLCTYNATEENKAKNRMRVDALLRNHLEARGLERKTDPAAHGQSHDVIYFKPKPANRAAPAKVKVWRDPSVATWTPDQARARKEREQKLRAEKQRAREQEMAEERASVRGIR
jgi:hypothetical protein